MLKLFSVHLTELPGHTKETRVSEGDREIKQISVGYKDRGSYLPDILSSCLELKVFLLDILS